MVRPDNKVLENQNKFIFSLLELRTEKHSNYELGMIRVGMIKKNYWYGSFFEIHQSVRDGEKSITYFDIFWTRYLLHNEDKKEKLKEFFNFSSVKSSTVTVWNMIDKFFYFLTNNPLWTYINGILKKFTPNTKNEVKRHAN